MTWGITIVKRDGTKSTKSQNVCGECKHGGNAIPGQPYRNGHEVCNVQAAAMAIGNLLTAIDVGADSHMAAGQAVLNCFGFEQRDPTP